MRPIVLNNLSDAIAIIEQFKQRSTISNCYLLPLEMSRLIDNGLLKVVIDDSNAFILEDKGNCLRIHYMINDTNALFDAECNKPLMLEILYKEHVGLPQSEVEYWQNSGLRQNLIRRNMTASNSSLDLSLQPRSNIKIVKASTQQQADFAKGLFNATFDPYSGDFISPENAMTMMLNGQLLIASVNAVDVGALNFYSIGKCTWLGHIAVTNNARRQGVGQALVSEYIRCNQTSDKSRYALWVQAQNESAIRMYTNRGFKFTDKASLSMIRN